MSLQQVDTNAAGGSGKNHTQVQTTANMPGVKKHLKSMWTIFSCLCQWRRCTISISSLRWKLNIKHLRKKHGSKRHIHCSMLLLLWQTNKLIFYPKMWWEVSRRAILTIFGSSSRTTETHMIVVVLMCACRRSNDMSDLLKKKIMIKNELLSKTLMPR